MMDLHLLLQLGQIGALFLSLLYLPRTFSDAIHGQLRFFEPLVWAAATTVFLVPFLL